MKSLLNYALFNGVWFVAVFGAAEGHVWWGLIAALVMLVVHLSLVPDRLPELGFVIGAGLAGAVIDSAMTMSGALRYPTSAEGWSFKIAPPWIFALWFAFAMMPRFSLAWLRGRPKLGFVLGAIGGPLSFLGGNRLGVIEGGSPATWLLLAVEYAILTPVFLKLAPTPPLSARKGEGTSPSP